VARFYGPLCILRLCDAIVAHKPKFHYADNAADFVVNFPYVLSRTIFY